MGRSSILDFAFNHSESTMLHDKPHEEFVSQFENSVNTITLIDIPNQEGSISKEEFKKKLSNQNVHTAKSIKESLNNRN